MDGRLPVSSAAIHAGLVSATLPGRFQIIPGPVEWILDVAHNPHAATALANQLRTRPCTGRTWAITGILADKDAPGVIEALTGVVDTWYAVSLDGPRGRSGEALAALIRSGGGCAEAADIQTVCPQVQAIAGSGDRIVVFGSFHLVAPVLALQPWRSNSPWPLLREA